MRRTDRLFQIIQLLRTSKRVRTAKWLASELEVSERTIYRDIQDLACSGVPIDGEAGVGYILRKSYDLPPLMFNKEELAALTLGAQLVNSCTDSKLAAAATQALGKINIVLPNALKTSSQEPYMFSPFSRISNHVADTLANLRQSIEQRYKIEFDYCRADKQKSNRTVRPLGLFFWGEVWTLAAWCELRTEFRSFRLDRMSKIEIKEEYTLTPGYTLSDYFSAMVEKKKC